LTSTSGRAGFFHQEGRDQGGGIGRVDTVAQKIAPVGVVVLFVVVVFWIHHYLRNTLFKTFSPADPSPRVSAVSVGGLQIAAMGPLRLPVLSLQVHNTAAGKDWRCNYHSGCAVYDELIDNFRRALSVCLEFNNHHIGLVSAPTYPANDRTATASRVDRGARSGLRLFPSPVGW
jgi:hypothetical protein